LTPAMGCIQPYTDTFMALWFAENFQIFQFWSDLKQISFPAFQICSEEIGDLQKIAALALLSASGVMTNPRLLLVLAPTALQ